MASFHVSREARRYEGITVSTSQLSRPPASARRATSPPRTYRAQSASSDTRCAWCDNPASSRCGSCQTIRYCSPECQRACWPIHKPLCKVDPTSFRFPPMRASEIEALERYKGESYGGPMTSYDSEGSLLQRLPTYLPPGVGALNWPDIVTILQSPTPTEPVDEAHDIREQVHAHARAQLYNYVYTDTMPHGVTRTWIRIAHHVVACLFTWERSKHGRPARLNPGAIFRVYHGYLRQCALFQWARDIAFEAVRTSAPEHECKVAASRAFELIRRAQQLWERESADVQAYDQWMTVKLTEYLLQMGHARGPEGELSGLQKEDRRRRVAYDPNTGSMRWVG